MQKGIYFWSAELPGGGLNNIRIVNNTFWGSHLHGIGIYVNDFPFKARNTIIQNNIFQQLSDSPGYIGIKNDFIVNKGVHTEWFGGTANPEVTQNTVTIGGVKVDDPRLQNSTATQTDTLFFVNPEGDDVAFPAGTVAGTSPPTATGSPTRRSATPAPASASAPTTRGRSPPPPCATRRSRGTRS